MDDDVNVAKMASFAATTEIRQVTTFPAFPALEIEDSKSGGIRDGWGKRLDC